MSGVCVLVLLLFSGTMWKAQAAITVESMNSPHYYWGTDDLLAMKIVFGDGFKMNVVCPGLNGNPASVSLQWKENTNYYLRAHHSLIDVEDIVGPPRSEGTFAEDASFIPHHDCFFPGYMCFRLAGHSGRYIRHQQFRLVAAADDGSNAFKEDASWKSVLEKQALCRCNAVYTQNPYMMWSYNYPDYAWGTRDDDDDMKYYITKPAGKSLNLVPGLTGQRGTVSFQDPLSPSSYLRHYGPDLDIEDIVTARRQHIFAQDATFYVHKSLYFFGYESYESVNFLGYFIRHKGFRLKISYDDASLHFEAEASFQPRSSSGI